MAAPAPAVPGSPYRFTPRSILDRPYWEGLRAEARHAEVLARIEKTCAEAPPEPPVPHGTTFLAARRANDRRQSDHFWQAERGRLCALAVRRCLLGLDPRDPDDRLLDWLWAFLTAPTWAVSAHLPRHDLPALGRPALDLAACEMAALLAELREALRPWMDSVSGTLAGSVVAAVDAQVLTPYGEGCEVWWQDRPHQEFNNWTGVCAGSILAACESLAAQGHPRPKARARALAGLRLFLERGFTPHGECDEGVGYWSYGVGFACLGWSRLEPEELTAQADLDRLRLIADYPRRAHLFANDFFSGNDGGLRYSAPLEFVPWLAAVSGNAFLSRWAAEHPALSTRHFGQILRMLAAPAAPSSPPAPLPGGKGKEEAQWLEDQQVAVLRLPTKEGELLAALTGGTNAERHNHNDLGHFLVALNGQFIIPDLGAPHYQADFFGPKRYTYVLASSRGHCCPLIGEFEQRAGKEAAGRVLAWEPGPAAKLVLDLTAAYPPEAGLQLWTRSLERRPGGGGGEPARFVLTDVFRTQEPNQRITHVLWSLEGFQEPDERVMCGGVAWRLGPLGVELSPAPTALGCTLLAPSDLLLRDWAGRKLHRIDAVYRTDEKGELKIETRFLVG
jgi:hypothetical protein